MSAHCGGVNCAMHEWPCDCYCTACVLTLIQERVPGQLEHQAEPSNKLEELEVAHERLLTYANNVALAVGFTIETSEAEVLQRITQYKLGLVKIESVLATFVDSCECQGTESYIYVWAKRVAKETRELLGQTT